MNQSLDTKRILIFLAFAFGIAWLAAWIIFRNGGLAGSPEIIPGSGISLAVALVAVVYMGAPAVAHLLTRLVTRQGFKDLQLRPKQRGWLFWVAAWILPAIMTILGGAFFYAVFPRYFDPNLGTLQEMLKTTPEVGGNLWMIVALQTISAVLIAPVVNGLFTFGEEFGWRAYLLPSLMPLGSRKAVLLSGVIWGVWHWPIIAMGHNYGLDYYGAPWTGMLMMVWFTVCVGTFLSWVTLRSACVWPAVIGHAAINGISALAVFALRGAPSTLLGPLPTGIVASVAWALLAVALLLSPGALKPAPQAAPQQNT